VRLLSLTPEACQLDVVARRVEDAGVTDRFSDPAWWPKPRPRPQQPLGGQLVWMLVPLVAIGGAVVALTLIFAPHHAKAPGSRAPACAHAGGSGCGAAPAPVPEAQARMQNAKQELEACMRQAGATGGGGSPFARGPSERSREAFDVCRSVLRGGGGSTAPTPAPTSTAAPPVA